MLSSLRFLLFGLLTTAGILLVASCNSSESSKPSTADATEQSADVVASETESPAQSHSDSEATASTNSEASAGGNSTDTNEKDTDKASVVDTAKVKCPIGPEGGVVSITFDTTKFKVQPRVNRFKEIYNGMELTEPRTVDLWIRSDLNEDQRKDIGLAEDCGRTGCAYSLYVACGTDRYVPVLKSEFSYDFDLFHPDSTKWATGTGYTPKAFTETKNRQRWRQLMKVPNLDLKSGSRHYPTLL